MKDDVDRRLRLSSWGAKFQNALRGIWIALRGSTSFAAHLAVAAAVVVAAAVLQVDWLEWCMLCACIAGVLAAEAFNSALESLARAISDQYHPRLRNALDISSGAVLIAAVGSVVIGAVIFLPRLIALLGA